MNVNDILNKALDLLGIGDVTVQSNSTDPRLAKLVNALGVAYLQLITEYAPLEKEESVTVRNGSFDLSTLTEKIFDAVRLTDEAGRAQSFRRKGNTLAAEDGRYLLRYYYTPSDYPAIGGTVEVPGVITLPLMARGVAAEYALESLMYEESLLHDKKYKEGLARVLVPHAGKRVSVTRWI